MSFSAAAANIFSHTDRDGTAVKQFIRNVRSAKTIADERAVIQKESAAIRASFREESHASSVRYVPVIQARIPRCRR